MISLHRLCPSFYHAEPCQELLLLRTVKTAVHELGHSVGLVHCRDRHCVMYGSVRIADTDFKETTFCPTCLELFQWQVRQCLSRR